MKNRMLSVILTVCMCLMLFPATALAANPSAVTISWSGSCEVVNTPTIDIGAELNLPSGTKITGIETDAVGNRLLSDCNPQWSETDVTLGLTTRVLEEPDSTEITVTVSTNQGEYPVKIQLMLTKEMVEPPADDSGNTGGSSGGNTSGDNTSNGSTSSGNTSGGSITITPSKKDDTTKITIPVSSNSSDYGTSETIRVGVTVTETTAEISVTKKELEKIISDDTKTIMVDVSDVENVENVNLPTTVIETMSEAEDVGVTVVLPAGSVTMDSTVLKSLDSALETVSNETDKSVTISVVTVETEQLSEEHKEIISSRTTMASVAIVVDVDIFVGGTKQTSFNGGKLAISVPYTPAEGEDTSKLTIWYITDDGKIKNMGGSYDAEIGCFVFETDHLSRYVLVSVEELPWENPFTDVSEGAWYYEAVKYVHQNGLMNGISANTFAPDGLATREQFVTVLWRMQGSPVVEYALSEFTDVNETGWYINAVRWAVSEGIFKGYGDGRLGIGDDITREQMATALYRFVQSQGGGFTGAWAYHMEFTDLEQLSDWAYEAVAWCNMHGIINGDENKALNPLGTATRSHMAQIFKNYLENVKDN